MVLSKEKGLMKRPIQRIQSWIRRQPLMFLALMAGVVSLVFLWLVVHNHDNLFVAAEIVHFTGISVLFYKLTKEKSCTDMRLHKTEAGVQEYAEFLHKPRERFKEFSLVRKEIQDETDKVTGNLRQISPIPIHLSIYSPNVVNLTLIDLLGLTKVAVEGQPESVVKDIENMVRSYVEKEIYCEATAMVEEYQQAISVCSLGSVCDIQGLYSQQSLKSSF